MHPDVMRIAELIGRTPSAVNLKIGNFRSFDPVLKEKGIVGLTHASKLDKEIWEEFNGKWDELSYVSEQLIANLQGKELSFESEDRLPNIPIGTTRELIIKQRINQNFFRKVILASYHNSCCITGLSNSELLVASHIKPWCESDEKEKTNPQNGLLLNSLHDKAFDKGFITITPDLSIKTSSHLSDIYNGETIQKFFSEYSGRKIIMPEKFAPDKIFLEYHNDVIFEKWK